MPKPWKRRRWKRPAKEKGKLPLDLEEAYERLRGHYSPNAAPRPAASRPAYVWTGQVTPPEVAAWRA